jgi:tRNA (mo5U34)-methyltransferase
MTPPSDFDVKGFFKGVYLFQDWEIFPGIRTSGPKSVEKTFERLSFPRDLTGKRVLDIGAWNGFFSFECARRGASEVVAFGPDDPDSTGFNKTRELLNVQNVKYVRESVYNIATSSIGQFDIVLLLGVIYHLRHPLLALDVIHDICSDLLFVDSPIIDDGVLIIPRPSRAAVSSKCWGEIQSIPLVYYSQADEWAAKRDWFNWFIPNAAALHDWIATSGFTVKTFSKEPRWAWVAARKAARKFEINLEGFNPGVAKTAD